MAETNLERAERELDGKDPAAHVGTGVELVASAIPFAGPVAVIANKITSGREMGKVKDMVRGLASELDRLGDRLSDFVTSDEFADEVIRVGAKVAYETREEKRAWYRNYLVNTAVEPGETDQRDMLIYALERLTFQIGRAHV